LYIDIKFFLSFILGNSLVEVCSDILDTPCINTVFF
jgi:hypothetical protein